MYVNAQTEVYGTVIHIKSFEILAWLTLHVWWHLKHMDPLQTALVWQLSVSENLYICKIQVGCKKKYTSCKEKAIWMNRNNIQNQ